MPITLTPVTPNPITADDVRMFMRDYPGNNQLLGQVQFGHEEISKALDFVVNEFNFMAPLTDLDIQTIPVYILALGAAAWLMMSESFLQIRNQASYQDGLPGPIGLDDKHQVYLAFSRGLREDFKQSSLELKKYWNADSCYGSLGSGYKYLTRLA